MFGQADVNRLEGHYVAALPTVSSKGHDKIVGLLLKKGAEVNEQGGEFGNALRAALVQATIRSSCQPVLARKDVRMILA